MIANNTVDGAPLGVSVCNFNEGGRIAVVQGNIIRNLMPKRPIGTAPDDDAGIGIYVEADTSVTGNVIENAPSFGIIAGWGKYLRDVAIIRQCDPQRLCRRRRVGGARRRHGAGQQQHDFGNPARRGGRPRPRPRRSRPIFQPKAPSATRRSWSAPTRCGGSSRAPRRATARCAATDSVPASPSRSSVGVGVSSRASASGADGTSGTDGTRPRRRTSVPARPGRQRRRRAAASRHAARLKLRHRLTHRASRGSGVDLTAAEPGHVDRRVVERGFAASTDRARFRPRPWLPGCFRESRRSV